MTSDSETVHLREEELRLFFEWKTAKTKRRREAAFLELCRRSKPARDKAVQRLANAYSRKHGEYVTSHMWLQMHNLTDQDISTLTTLAVLEAGDKFQPDRAKDKNRFTTYAHPFIVGKLYAAASVEDCVHRVTRGVVGEDGEELFSEHADLPATWKKAGEGRQSIPADSAISDQEDPTDRRLRYLARLSVDDGGFGKIHSFGAFLEALDGDASILLRDWLEENKDRATQVFGHARYTNARVLAGLVAWVKLMLPEVRDADLFADEPTYGLPVQNVAVGADGKKWNLNLPIVAALLRQRGFSERKIADFLGMPRRSYRDMRKREEEEGFTPSRFTPEELNTIVRGRKPGRPPKS